MLRISDPAHTMSYRPHLGNAPQAQTAARFTRTLIPTTVILLAFAIWLATLTQRSIWTDELATLYIFAAPDLPSVVQQVAVSERRPPLYFVLLWSWSRLAGTNEFALRYFSLGFTTLALAIWFALARKMRRLFDIQWAPFAWVALALGLLAPDLALYGVMLRYYSFLLCLSLGLNLIFVHWLAENRVAGGETHSAEQARTMGSVVVACWLGVAIMLAYTDYSVPALIFAQMLWLAFHVRSLRAKLRPWGIAFAILFISYLPLLGTLRAQASADNLQADLSQSAVGIVLKLLYPLYSYTFGETIFPWHVPVIAATPFVGLAFLGLLRIARTQAMVPFSVILISIPIIFNALIETIVATDLTFVTMGSRTWYVLPFFVMLVVLGVSILPTRPRNLAMATLAIANLAALGNLFAGEQYHNPIFAVPLRSVTETIRAESRPGDVIMADVDIGFHTYWQAQPAPGTQFVRSDDWPAPLGALQATPPGRVWLLSFGRDRTRVGDHMNGIRAWLAPNYVQRSERRYVTIDPGYRDLKQWLLGRETYDAKLTVQLYERTH